MVPTPLYFGPPVGLWWFLGFSFLFFSFFLKSISNIIFCWSMSPSTPIVAISNRVKFMLDLWCCFHLVKRIIWVNFSYGKEPPQLISKKDPQFSIKNPKFFLVERLSSQSWRRCLPKLIKVYLNHHKSFFISWKNSIKFFLIFSHTKKKQKTIFFLFFSQKVFCGQQNEKFALAIWWCDPKKLFVLTDSKWDKGFFLSVFGGCLGGGFWQWYPIFPFCFFLFFWVFVFSETNENLSLKKKKGNGLHRICDQTSKDSLTDEISNELFLKIFPCFFEKELFLGGGEGIWKNMLMKKENSLKRELFLSVTDVRRAWRKNPKMVPLVAGPQEKVSHTSSEKLLEE